MSQLAAALTRFQALYPLLSKQKAKSSQAGQVAAFHAAQAKAQGIPNQLNVEQLLTLKERLKIINTLAKSEVTSLPEQSLVDLLGEVATQADGLCHLPVTNASYCERDYFTLCLLVHVSHTTGQSNLTTDLLVNMVVRSQRFISEKALLLQGSEDAASHEISLTQDKDLDGQLIFVGLILQTVLKQDLKKDGQQTLQILQAASTSFAQFAAQNNSQAEEQGQLNIAKFATETIWIQVLNWVFSIAQDIQGKVFSLYESAPHKNLLSELLGHVFTVLELHKQNSKYFLTAVGTQKADQDEAKAFKRSSPLFTEILDILVSFIVQYLATLQSPEACQRLFDLLFLKQGDCQNFTLAEQLSILRQLNPLFYRTPAIHGHLVYWQIIREGLQEIDQVCRKIALNVLKENLKLFGEDRSKGVLQLHCSEKEFEQLWTTFFDVYDTLESFSSHLTKAVWHRIDLFYDFIKVSGSLMGPSDADGNFPANQLFVLEDFRSWLFVLYNRVSSHSNLKIRRFVQKTTLKRPFITEQMRGFYFGDFLAFLNQGHLFKDNKTLYTQFSKNSQQVHDFYCSYFTNESRNVAEDLRMLLVGMSRTATHHQVFLICLRLLATQFGQPGKCQFVGPQELAIIEKVFNSNFTDLYFSNKYLCKKFALQLLSHYLVVSETDPVDWKVLFKLLGSMNVEFFSSRTVFVDEEGLKAAARLIELLGRQRLQAGISEFLVSLFTVKALHAQMPKFGASYTAILTGISNSVLISHLVYSEPVALWFVQTLEQCMATFDSMLESTYLSSQLVESKVHCLELVLSHIYTYGNDVFRQRLRASNLGNRVGPILSRIIDNLVGPLNNKEILPSESEKLAAAFSNLKSYGRFLSLAIRMFHLHEKTSHNALQSFIKTILTESLKITSVNQSQDWGTYLLQHVTLSLIQAVFEAYATGIQESIKQGVDHFFVPDEIFQFGQPLLKNLITFRPQTKPNGLKEMLQAHQNFLVDQDLSLIKINQFVLIDCWKVIADTAHIFQFDPVLKQELLSVNNSQIATKAIDFLHEATEEYNTSLFKVLKISYLPTVIAALRSNDESDLRKTFEEVQQVFLTCWKIVKDLRTDISAETLQEFVELTFSPDLLESYQQHVRLPEFFESLTQFHTKLADDMIEHSNGYWLILRAFFNHLMFTFATRPHLMKSFEAFIYNFAMAREMRSLDAEIKLYKLQTMLPEAVPKDYENLPLEEITFQGAYIRTLTLIVVEGIIKQQIENVKQQVKQPGFDGVFTFEVEALMDSLETLMRETIMLNFSVRKMRKVEMPFGEGHRLKVRNWCFLIVLLQLLDPAVYTEAFRSQRVARGKGDVVADVLKYAWEAIKQHNLSSIRQYIEVFLIKFILKFPDLALNDPAFFQILLDPKITRPQISSSLLMIVGTILTSDLHSANAIAFKKKIFENLLSFTVSNSAHSRCIAQYFLMKLQQDKQFGSAFMPTAIQPILQYLNDSKDVRRVFEKYEEKTLRFYQMFLAQDGVKVVLCCRLDKEGEFISDSFVESLRDVITETVGELRKEDQRPPERKDYWKLELERRMAEENLELHINEQATNYQRKILPWEQIEFDQSQQVRENSSRKRNEIIIVASLIDKIPNLAGLARTSEIMNASSLIVDQADVTQNDEFRGIAVTSEKWLPIYEVREKELLSYLHYQKSNGYVILGIEQTANSKMLNEYKFPQKCILLLGKEKEGIPQEYYGILDQCIEIPQFGIIRSLNVHVSGALCLWEYTKQMIEAKK